MVAKRKDETAEEMLRRVCREAGLPELVAAKLWEARPPEFVRHFAEHPERAEAALRVAVKSGLAIVPRDKLVRAVEVLERGEPPRAPHSDLPVETQRANLTALAELLRDELPKLAAQPVENMVMFWCRDGQAGKVVLHVGDERHCKLDPQAVQRAIAENGLQAGMSAFALAHNHPNGWAMPSDDDVAANENILRMLRASPSPLLADHFIVAKRDPSTAVSMRLGAMLEVPTFAAGEDPATGAPALQAVGSVISTGQRREPKREVVEARDLAAFLGMGPAVDNGPELSLDSPLAERQAERERELATLNAPLRDWRIEWDGECCQKHASVVTLARKDGTLRAEFRGNAKEALGLCFTKLGLGGWGDGSAAATVEAFKEAQLMRAAGAEGFRVFETLGGAGFVLPAPDSIN